MAGDGGEGIVRESCGVAYRLSDSTVEFCLLLIPGDSRWEFPHGPIADEEQPGEAALRLVRELAGLECQMADTEPLGNFEFVSGGARRHVTAYLMNWLADVPRAPNDLRRLQWFLPEEARARLRRKPMRLLATLAQRRLSGPSA